MKQQHTNKPLVSVLMPVYNSERFIAQAIVSILKQTYRHFELVIADDASTDKSWSIIREFQQKYPKRIKTIRLKKNDGSTKATNAAFKKSTGEFIAILDSDDIAQPKRLEKQVKYLLKHPEVIVLGTQAKVINAENEIIGEKVFPTTHEEIYSMYGTVHPMNHPSIMIRRSLLPSSSELYQEKYGINDDYYNLFRLISRGKFANLPEHLLLYRVHGNNNSLKRLKKCYWNIFKIRLTAITQFGYRMQILSFLAMIVQTITVLTLPEKALQILYFTVKDIKVSQ